MQLLRLVNPARYLRGISFLHWCWAEREFVGRCLVNRPVVELWLRDQGLLDLMTGAGSADPSSQGPERNRAFLERCLAQRNQVEFYLDTKHQLQEFSVVQGSVLFPHEHAYLKELIEKANSLPGPIVEIGTLFGFTTTNFALWAKPGKKIITVDNYSWNPWGVGSPVHRQLTRQFLAYPVETGQVELVDMDKHTFYETYQGEPPAMVFFDSLHTYEETKADITWAKRVGAQIITGHDYAEDFSGLVRAVTEGGGLGGRAGAVWALNSGVLGSQRGAA